MKACGLTATCDSDRQLAELDALDRDNHPYFLAVSYSAREEDFLIDLRLLQDRCGSLAAARLTCHQAGWLEAIHRKARAQCREADRIATGNGHQPPKINMRKYSIGA